MTAKQKNIWKARLRAGIQIVFFIFFPSVYTAAFSGVKSVFTQIGAGEKIVWNSFLMALAGVCIYTMVFGRFFCGFACAFGSLGDAVRALYVKGCRRIRRQPVTIPEIWRRRLSFGKYIILAGIVFLCFQGSYSRFRGASPWDVFSMLHAGNFRLGDYFTGVILLVVILMGMCVEERFFCRNLCPMGAVFSLLPVLPLFSLRRDREACVKGCSGCERNCPSDIGLPEIGSYKTPGDCFQCQKCIRSCPRANIRCGIEALKGNEVWFTVVRAGLLLLLLVRLGV